MRQSELPEHVREAIIDRLEGWELVEFLQVPIEQVLDMVEDVVALNLDDVKDLINIREENS